MVGKRVCPFGKCHKCFWWREFRLTNTQTGEEKREEACGLDMLLNYIPAIQGAIDGLQGGVNEAGNRARETKEVGEAVAKRIVQFAYASHKALEKVSEKLIEGGKK